LLRPCLPHGEWVSHPRSRHEFGKPLAKLPPFLDRNVGTAVKLTLARFRKYLLDERIPEADLGGPLSSALPKARYLVIHDTSYKYDNWLQSFPAEINTLGYVHNRRATLNQKRDAHVFVSRVGESNTAHDFSVPFSATKYTNLGHSAQALALKSKFCHVEMIQPRLGNPGHPKSDWMSPDPGFPSSQMDRLALIYIAASFRHGEWLIPAYHHNVDIGFDAHDDPQHFDLDDWDERINDAVTEMTRTVRPGDYPAGAPPGAG
jgi:hypothetical protein